MFKIWVALIVLSGLLVSIHSQDLPLENNRENIARFSNSERQLPSHYIQKYIGSKEIKPECQPSYCCQEIKNKNNFQIEDYYIVN